VIEEYELVAHHILLVTAAGEAWDRREQAREAIKEHGITYTDRFGDPRPRPEISIERDSRLAFARLIRELDLDTDPPVQERSRPAPLRSNRR
jgi:phage terminase small subunit